MSDPAIEAAKRAWVDRYGDAQLYRFNEVVDDDGDIAAFVTAAAREMAAPLRDKHKPLVIPCLAPECGAEFCDHEDECPADYPVTFCAECWHIAQVANMYVGEEGIPEELLWPCATAKLIYSAEELAS